LTLRRGFRHRVMCFIIAFVLKKLNSGRGSDVYGFPHTKPKPELICIIRISLIFDFIFLSYFASDINYYGKTDYQYQHHRCHPGRGLDIT
jgi:hypothetical protein